MDEECTDIFLVLARGEPCTKVARDAESTLPSLGPLGRSTDILLPQVRLREFEPVILTLALQGIVARVQITAHAVD